MVTDRIIGCIHLPPLPGSPGYAFNNHAISEKALHDLEVYSKAGLKGLIVENTSDIPYLKGSVYPETVSLLSIICHEIRKRYDLRLGLQVLAGANIEALSIACNTGFDFIRAEGYAFAHIADEGFIQSCAADLMRKRAYLRANRVKIIADVKKKHSSHAITSDLSLADVARLTEYMEPDGIVVTGTATGEAPSVEEVTEVKKNVSLPVYIGSGVTIDNARDLAAISDYLIVGSYFKKNGYWKNDLDEERVKEFMRVIRGIDG